MEVVRASYYFTTPQFPTAMKIALPTTVDQVVAGDAGSSIDNPIDALIIGAGPSGEAIIFIP